MTITIEQRELNAATAIWLVGWVASLVFTLPQIKLYCDKPPSTPKNERAFIYFQVVLQFFFTWPIHLPQILRAHAYAAIAHWHLRMCPCCRAHGHAHAKPLPGATAQAPEAPAEEKPN